MRDRGRDEMRWLGAQIDEHLDIRPNLTSHHLPEPKGRRGNKQNSQTLFRHQHFSFTPNHSCKQARRTDGAVSSNQSESHLTSVRLLSLRTAVQIRRHGHASLLISSFKVLPVLSISPSTAPSTPAVSVLFVLLRLREWVLKLAVCFRLLSA